MTCRVLMGAGVVLWACRAAGMASTTVIRKNARLIGEDVTG
jgi:hypothetical protein